MTKTISIISNFGEYQNNNSILNIPSIAISLYDEYAHPKLTSRIYCRTNMKLLKRYQIYEDSEYYYVVIPGANGNRLDSITGILFTIYSSEYLYCLRLNNEEELNKLGITLVEECNFNSNIPN